MTLSRAAFAAAVAALALAAALWWATVAAMVDVAAGFVELADSVDRPKVTDRHGTPLNATYANDWNLHDVASLYDIPEFLVGAFVLAEDKRFYAHSGQDWIARLHAVKQNVLARETVRGASTISEQVVRMIHPRPRTLWARWLEGWEAERLVRERGKLDVLEFYLNQVPYAANRRGVAQAAHYYFDRDLDTLSRAEMLALAVLVRAPSRLDPYRGDAGGLRKAMAALAVRLPDAGLPNVDLGVDALALAPPTLAVQAGHFLGYVARHEAAPAAKLRTTLDAGLQRQAQALLDQRLAALAHSRVANGALLVADHGRGQVRAWVSGAADGETPGRLVDAVTAPRQPGSALKPFLYALALQKGWTAATLIDDSPLAEMVGFGLHAYRNYSRTFHGPLTLREALGNSLNIPALRTLSFVGAEGYLALLRQLGFETLTGRSDHYGDGLALGNGEVTLLELVQAYAALANRGVFQRFAVRAAAAPSGPRRVFSAEVASLVGSILSDSDARQREFGRGGVLDLPVQTAVKTGTSNDYRDSWAVGYDDRHVVGVWLGNLDRTATAGITGASGPALVLRGTFDLLNEHRETAPLWLSPRLVRHTICGDTGAAYPSGAPCPRRGEYFVPGTAPIAAPKPVGTPDAIRLRQPTPGLHLALDPRLPQTAQAFEFLLQGVADDDQVQWRIDGAEGAATASSVGGSYLWPLARGEYGVTASVWRNGQLLAALDETRFRVK